MTGGQVRNPFLSEEAVMRSISVTAVTYILCLAGMVLSAGVQAQSHVPERSRLKQLFQRYEAGLPLNAGEQKQVTHILREMARQTPSSPMAITTGTALLLNESFEDTLFPPTGWTQFVVSGPLNWVRSSQRALDGSFSAFITFARDSIDVWLISPPLDLSDAALASLTYYENVNLGFFGITHQTLVSTDYTGSGDPTAATWTVLRDAIGAEDQWVQISLDLASFTGSSPVYIAFRYAGFDGDEWFIDLVQVNKTVSSPAPQTDISPDTVNYGDQNLFTASTAQTFTITNIGQGALTITDVSITGTDASQFLLTDLNSYPVSLNLGESITVDVAFKPTSEGAKTAQLAVTDNQLDALTTALLQGNGVDYNSGGGGPGSGGYFFANSLAINAPSHPQFNWIDISGTGTDIISLMLDDDAEGPIPLGFDFPFFGVSYNRVWIGSDGWVSFTDPTGLPGNQMNTNVNIPTEGGLENFVALFWDDLDPTDPDIVGKHLYYGTDASGNFVVTYEHYPQLNLDTDPNSWITAQIILKRDGNIKLQYLESGTSINLNTSSVGIENADGTLGVEYRQDGVGGPYFSSPLAVEFGMNDAALPVQLSSFTARGGDGFITLEWITESEVDNLGFEVYRANSRNGEYQMIDSYVHNPALEGAGNSSTRRVYRFTDRRVVNGFTYWYKIADVANSGLRMFHGPVSATAVKGTVVTGTGEVPEKFALHPNHPNPFSPFNPATRIPFDIPRVRGGTIEVNLSIYDALGRKIRTLVDGPLAPDSYVVEWDGKDEQGRPVASGVYLYGIRSHLFIQFRKLLVIR